ncbi:hypothetical protein EDEG_03980 [Edhazardia aedis USNM 41457]|uniref:NAD(P)H-hydrate epimerase n=1 Tax=Edhazardia aedis (strain USNM 41457) TaxID=1003232 RepID=J9DFL6_EDHAE|nr:hypothetical protein EDEG_03980 [Edhazardia aedis USNM 41457]|eukprot:EJW01395.1 hypothetical protein EDEG_03980 [Edhazardia aedis USNM 41457]
MRYLTQAESKQIDESLLKLGFSFEQLVEIAGYAAVEVIINLIQQKKCNVLVIVGPGNNGADGLVIARWLSLFGHNVHILCNLNTMSTLNIKLLNICKNMRIDVHNTYPNTEITYIIDAIFGISFRSPVQEPYSELVNCLKNKKNVISIDVPSGYEIDALNSKREFLPMHVVCFVGPKKCCQGLQFTVARSFIPKNIFLDDDYTNFFNYTTSSELKKSQEQ